MMFDVLNAALNGMTKGPRPLFAALKFSADNNVDGAEQFSIDALLKYLKDASPSDTALSTLRKKLGHWDNEQADWCSTTERNTCARRAFIYTKLQVPAEWVSLCDERLPFHTLERATVIATSHTPWYSAEIRSAHAFYWPRYCTQLEKQGWPEESLRQLDESTTSVVERLANPTAEGAYQSKGLVIGYVQSGKTANFTGVMAKAADAGYKLIIVMGGVLDVLRSQTQRRIDKELIGKELLLDEYATDPDYSEFVSHGARPSTLGAFDWYRLTGPDADYQGLDKGFGALKFEAKDPDIPFWNPNNLYAATARIAVIKKHPNILQKLAHDLRALTKDKLGAPLHEVPTLIIDDESDQASINTSASSDRTATNRAIVALLNMLPRSQYLGYTATPSANVLVDPAATEDIFPKDFLISLPRPANYMGVADFYDLDKAPDDEIGPKQRDYVRSVEGDDNEPDNLQKAIDAFVLSGALKRYRTAQDASLKFKHHTMLAHVSTLQTEHKALAADIRKLFGSAGYDGGKGIDRLATLFESDFGPVHQSRGIDLPFPESFEALTPHIGDCLSLIGEASEAIRIVNNANKKDTPDFDRQPIWKILVGGAKLSRGYTVEGLTVSYYRRRAGASDTLMQMGRWFGFRRGYQDLVRLFIGTNEIDGPKNSKKRINLYEAFGAICRDEEVFRDELKRYAEDHTITPANIPPLVPAHMLRLTAPNKMRNAVVSFRNYGGELAESTFAPNQKEDIQANNDAFAVLLGKQPIKEVTVAGEVRGNHRELKVLTATLGPDALIKFLESYRWYDSSYPGGRAKNQMRLVVEFLKGRDGDPELEQWLLFAPQIKGVHGKVFFDNTEFEVVYRSRHPNSAERFNTYNDPAHREFAEHITRKRDVPGANEVLEGLRKPRTGVMIYYPISALKDGEGKPPFTVGFTLLFPPNNIGKKHGFTVRQADKAPEAIVAAD